MSGAVAALERLDWHDDRVVLDGLELWLETPEQGGASDVSDRLILHKRKRILNEYAHLLRAHPAFAPQRILELGIWGGGSTALWYELFEPRKLVAVDVLDREDSDAFARYVASRGAEDRISTFWSTDQADRGRLREIVSSSFDGPLDLVVDDASHLYEPTKTSFETLFPLLAPGGLYVVEDWPWGHLSRYREPGHPWANETPLTDLLVEIVRAAGSAPDLVRRVHVCPAFFAVERGPEEGSNMAAVSLDELVSRLRGGPGSD